jgi:myo-inositol-1(or 4)-monophosphatase
MNEYLKAAEEIAQAAGALLRDAYVQPRQIAYKGAVDLITQADRDAETLIVQSLKATFPEHSILSEESGAVAGGNGYRWIIDPLDGTTNFAHGFPVFAVSIALHGPEGLLAGVVYDPMRDECFTAVKGEGARLNGRPIQPSAVDQLKAALVVTGFPYNRHTAPDNNSAAFAAFIRRAQGVRRVGAAALDLAYVACGRLDGYWEFPINSWDIAAGMLLVKEAGGMVTTYQAEADEGVVLREGQIVASNGHIHQAMIATLHEVHDQ